VLGLLLYGYKVIKRLIGYKLSCLSPSRGSLRRAGSIVVCGHGILQEFPLSSTQLPSGLSRCGTGGGVSERCSEFALVESVSWLGGRLLSFCCRLVSFRCFLTPRSYQLTNPARALLIWPQYIHRMQVER
jgi:phosphate/sulfate permease